IALNGYCPVLPEMLGGSADLTGSNLTNWSGSRTISKDNADGNYISYGVREFGMAAIGNGIALHGGLIPYSGTFLMFSEYARNALRMAALMKIRNIFVFTHDSIGLGEDGPTHQAVEQAATLRLLPNMSVWRPCDTVETAVAWRHAIERTDGPTALLLSRQSLPHQPRTAEQRACIKRGGYVMDGEDHADKPLDVILIATGSEVEIAHQATHVLREYGLNARLVCIPSTDVFDQQDVGYKESVLPAGVRARVAVEAGVSDGWRKYVGLDGAVVGLDTFGESGPAEQVFEHFGFTVDNVVDTVKALISKS
ncbi:MAG: transketolase-like TK C-terminal-containing protein, partial [Arenicellales bacterium WSBS_2016_MAG_OTU3]